MRAALLLLAAAAAGPTGCTAKKRGGKASKAKAGKVDTRDAEIRALRQQLHLMSHSLASSTDFVGGASWSPYSGRLEEEAGTLPAEVVAAYRRDGHVLLRGFLAPEEIGRHRETVAAQASKPPAATRPQFWPVDFHTMLDIPVGCSGRRLASRLAGERKGHHHCGGQVAAHRHDWDRAMGRPGADHDRHLGRKQVAAAAACKHQRHSQHRPSTFLPPPGSLSTEHCALQFVRVFNLHEKDPATKPL